MKSTWTARVSLLAGLLVGNARAQTCYNTWGKEDTNMQPCSATGTTDASTTTWCCNKGDTCLSNGLCLSPQSNLMTQQGCTDQNWGGSCTRYCPASSDQNSAEIPLVPCPSSFDNTTNTVKFCCGPDPASCCSHPISWLTIPAGTVLTPSTTTTSSSSQTKNPTLTIGLGIGLGIGIPILLVLLAVAYLLSQPLHSRSSSHRRKRKPGTNPGGTGSGSSKTEKTAPSEITTASYPARRTRRDRHGSFGHVDTNIRPSTDDGDSVARHHHHFPWPPPPPAVLPAGAAGGGGGGHGSVAAAIARWARSPFGFGGAGLPLPGSGGLEEAPPPSPKEMDGRGRGVSRGRGQTPSRLGAAELAASLGTWESGVGFGVGVEVREEGGGRGWWKGRGRVVVAAEEVELPTPDTPETDVEKGLDNGGRSRGRLV